MKSKLLLLITACFLVLPTQFLRAGAIDWSNSIFDELYTSQGVALDNSFSFEMGMFINGFTPAADNIADWALNWIVFDASYLNTGEVYPGSGPANFFAGTAHFLENGTSSSPYATPDALFPQNSQAYLWVYNSKDIGFTSEWALVTDFNPINNVVNRWLFPDPADAMSANLEWRLEDADTAIFGALHSGSSTGGGSVSSQPSSFSLQTYQVPEPGGALLVASAGLLLMLRRARFMRH